ncbi:MAG: hypothetical protein R2765_00695 [Ferruginibacter sp.]|nr:hypothetical protein [Bacteroidota bacterium]MBX2920229.1 hypothetical protein [Ferruginibacter sp.]MCB0710322.1 hypothetical protein [Chitinophagaceae bacterium]MCC7377911.1 hypothetical protein [Chitinophagaceae bacterium]
MKLKPFLAALGVATFALCLNSCKKVEEQAQDYETTFELSTDQAISDNFTEDANQLFLQAAVENNVAGSGFAPGPIVTNNFIPCATVTITPLLGFPKTIVIDFGTSCTGPYGIVRSGKINIVISDSVRKVGSTAIMTFDNYFVSGYKIEGTYTWTNTGSTATTRSWERKTENGKVTAPTGKYWLHQGVRNVIQNEGVGTPWDLTDDAFLVTGNHRVTNQAGAYRDITVLEALHKRNDCHNIDKGKLKVQGPNHYAVIDYGDGTCNNLATISIDGRPERTIILW